MTGTLAEESREARDATVVSSVVRGLASDLSPEEMLHLAARLARQLLEADRATILLLDARDRLVPEVSVANTADEELYARFREMTPIALTGSGPVYAVLAAGEVIVVERAAESMLVPEEWRSAFGLQSLAIAPLLLEGKPCGALVVEGPRLTDPSRPSSMRAMASIAAMTALAVGGSRRRRTELADLASIGALRETSKALHAARDVDDVLDSAIEGFLQLLPGRWARLSVTGRDGVEEGASRGRAAAVHPDVPGPGASCRRDPATGLRVVTVPVQHGESVRGRCVVADLAASPTPAVLRAADVLGDLTASRVLQVAADRERDVERRAMDLLRAPVGMHLVDRLDEVLRDLGGMSLVELVVSPAHLVVATGARRPAGEVARAMARWRRSSGSPSPISMADDLLLPLGHEGRLLGAFRVRRGPRSLWDTDLDTFLAKVAAGLLQLLRDVETRHEASVAEQRFVELSMWRAQLRELVPAARARARAGAAADALDSLLEATERPVSEQPLPLPRALPDIVRRAAGADVEVVVRVGTTTGLPLRTDVFVRGLVDDVVRALLPRSRASRLAVDVHTTAESLTLVVRDDGLPLGHRATAATRLFERLRSLAVRCDAKGGSLEASNLVPLGVQVVASLPFGPLAAAQRNHRTHKEEHA